MSKSSLEVLFASKARVKILKFLFRNQETKHTLLDISERVQENKSVVQKELRNFDEIGLVESVKLTTAQRKSLYETQKDHEEESEE